MAAQQAFKPTVKQDDSAYSRALESVGTMANFDLHTTLDEVLLTQAGVEPNAVDALAGVFRASKLEWVIKRRTLSHRKAEGARLTPEETGRWLRAAKLYKFAEEVFGCPDKAAAWFKKPRSAFADRSASELIQTEPGARIVEDMLHQIDAGFFA